MSTSELGYDAPTGDLVSGSWYPLADITHVTVVEGCGCAICQGLREAGTDGTKSKGGFNEANPDNENIGVLLPLVTNPDGSRSITGDRNVDATLIGSKWGTLDLTFSFPTSGSNYNGPNYDSNGVSLYHLDLGAQQQAAARAGFAQISAFTNLTFTEITETDTVHANIRISQSGDSDVGSAYGGFPSDTRTVAGDIWFGRTSQPYYDLAGQGTWGFSTMLHEIGHTMGLKHGHQSYTNSDLSFYFGTTPRYGTQSLTADKDGQAWSLMTYTPAPFTNGGFAGEKVNQPQTYMQYDIAALQYMYGANYKTNATDSVYTFSQTTGEMFINGVSQGDPAGDKILLTIWDGGGNDTINASNYAGGVTIDLRPGEFSTLDQSQLANHLAYQNLTALAPGNIAMSLLFNNDTRSLIENATGGAGNDVFVGNSANNLLDGGAGSDTVVFTNPTGINVTLNDSGADVIVTHDGETDTLRSIENIGGTSGNDTLTGNSQNNILTGGSGGADTLSGGGGDDRLLGGGFTTTTTFSAPSQADITKDQATNNGSIATAVNTAGAFDVDANPNITNATSVPHATINATATGGSVEYYKVEVTQAGAQAVFDIDGTGTLTDSIIELVNAAGTVLASNDTGPGDPGTTTGDDAYISYTFATAGIYYIRVGQWTGTSIAQPLTAGQTYQLNISLQGAAVVTTTVTANNTSSAVLDGGDGNDLLQGTIAADSLTGGAGSDTASFVHAFSGGSTTGVTVDLNVQGVAQNTVAAGSDTLTGIENLIGSALNDTLTGNGSDNVIEGGLGADALAGGAGVDTASYAGAAAGVTVSLAAQGAAQNTGTAAGTDTLSGFENLQGSAFADTLSGDAAANTISGGAGDDTLNPGANAAGAVDLLDGGAGSDTASFAGLGPVTATLNGAADGTATIGGATVANLRNIENLLGGAGADVLTGDANANVIDGGLGDDLLDGGAGVDTVSFRGSAPVTVNLATLTAQNTGAGNDTIVGFENVRTGSGADSITGDGADNTFFDAGGADSYNGAAGSDTIDYTNITSALTVNLGLATAQAASTGGDILSGIENVTGSLTGANTLTGNAAANRLVGGSAADLLAAGAGNDTVIGGAGNDTLFGDNNGTISAQEGADVLEGGAGNDFIVGGQGNDTLRGGDGDDQLVGGVASASQAFTNDGGQDTFDGGEGSDIAYAYYTDQTGAIAFDLANIAGNSAITMGGVAAGSFTSIERIIFRGGSGADTVKGGGTLDTLVGNAGDDVLDGWLGNDTLSGGLGNDTLNGGDGLDTATYVNSAAGVNVDLRIQGAAQDTGGEGVDTLIGIEYVTGSNFGDTLRGNDEFNLIIDNAVSGAAGQTDSLFGYGGNDSIFVTRAATAVATNVNIDGGAGDDFLEVRSGSLSAGLAANAAGLSGNTYAALGTTSNRFLDTVVVDGGAGNDRIVLTGVKSAVVDAGSGNDILSLSLLGAASESKHTVTLGAGQDIIQLAGTGAVASTVDHGNVVTDFQVGNAGDRFEMTQFLNGSLLGYTANSDPFTSGHLRLVQSGTDLLLQVDRDDGAAVNGFVTVFTINNGYTGGFTTFNFDGFIGELTLTGFAGDETITGAIKNDTLSGGDGNDVLIGLAGNDILDGGNGNDTLLGGTGDDTLIGGAGSDTASYSDATAGVTVNVNLVGAQATGAGSDSLSGIENLTGSAFNDALTGDAGANLIGGGAGDDALSGGAGADVLDGGSGNDTLDGGADNDTADGGEGNDLLTGGDGDDTLRGGAGNDRLSGNAGTDALAGGLGNDVYVIGEAVDSVTELAGEGTDTVESSISYTLGANVENLTLTGAAGISGTGNELNNVIIGNAAANVLTGNAGDDVLMGGAGKDTLYGGDGFDTASWANATQGVKVSVGNNFNGDSGEGDKFYSIEKIEGSGFNDELNGSNGNDTLFGMGGDDKIIGGNGRDTLFGGDGIDFMEGGNDVDTLDGGAGNDTLLGGNEGDTLNGGAGNDRLSGGNGKDLFVFDDAGTDTISDYQRGEKIDLSAFGVDSSDVTITSGKIFVDLEGDNDLTILFQGGSTATMNDLIFADPAAISTSQAGAAQNEQIMIV